MNLTIVIPAHNEEKRIGKKLESYGSFFNRCMQEGLIKNVRIIVVLNACRDKTEKVVKEWQKKYRKISYLSFAKGGKGFALIEGFKEALRHDNDLIGFVDADLSTSPEEFYRLISELDGFDGLLASRYVPGAEVRPKQPLSRILVSRLGNYAIRCLFLFPYRDTQCGAKLFRSEALREVVPKLTITQWGIDVDLLYQLHKCGYSIGEMPTVWQDAEGTKLNLRKASLQVFFAIVQLRLRHSPFRKAMPLIYPLARPLWNRLQR